MKKSLNYFFKTKIKPKFKFRYQSILKPNKLQDYAFIIIINFILDLEYISEADLNVDNSVDILDVILLVNIIIN